MNIAIIAIISFFVLSGCTYSDMTIPSYDTGTITQVITGTINTGTTYYTGTVTQFVTGIISTGSTYQAPLTEDLSGKGDVYYPFFKGLEKKTIRIKHQSGVPTKILFMNSEAKSIEVSIVFPSAEGANLRFSQIVMPSGTTDGPFGQSTGYNLAQFGGYQLIFSENMMAGEPWSGEAIITLTLRDIPYDQNAVLLK